MDASNLLDFGSRNRSWGFVTGGIMMDQYRLIDSTVHAYQWMNNFSPSCLPSWLVSCFNQFWDDEGSIHLYDSSSTGGRSHWALRMQANDGELVSELIYENDWLIFNEKEGKIFIMKDDIFRQLYERVPKPKIEGLGVYDG